MANNSIRWIGEDDWTIQEMQVAPRRSSRPSTRRGAAGSQAAVGDIQQILDDKRFSVLKEFMVTPGAGATRRGGEPELAFEIDAPADGSSVLAVRHPSGAISFHAPEVLATVRRGGKSVGTARFYHNEERDVSLLTGTPKLDAQSKKGIQKALGATAAAEISAVEKLFSLFRKPGRTRT